MHTNRTRRFRTLAVVSVLAVSLVFFPGCGKKGDPVCPDLVKPEAVSDLSATAMPNGMELAWTVEGNHTDDGFFKILKSEVDAGGSRCRGCPRAYSVMADLSFRDAALRWEGDTNVSYLDREVRHGSLYTYKVLICDGTGNCSDESVGAEAVFP